MYKLRFYFSKADEVKYVGHLDTIELFDRAFRRARLPISFSEGFNPRPKLTFAHPLAVGISSNGEIGEVELTEKMDEQEFISKLNSALPSPIRIVKVEYVEDKKSLMSLVKSAEYTLQISDDSVTSEDIENILNKESIEIEKTSKSGKISVVNIKPLILSWEWVKRENKEVRVDLVTGSSENLRPDTIIKLFGEVEKYKIIREKINI
jgi:radical SAM-linked protein